MFLERVERVDHDVDVRRGVLVLLSARQSPLCVTESDPAANPPPVLSGGGRGIAAGIGLGD
ncbi:hypothetical protein [Streptomyces sp. NPDC057939]|uniref:hypothetical protein n=1 Tax=Streptomyces sp. NPDC057939 TaxID=3346284 RepID=UPI0036E95AA0